MSKSRPELEEEQSKNSDGLSVKEKRSFTTWLVTLFLFFGILWLAKFDFTQAPSYLALLLFIDIAIGSIAFLFFFKQLVIRLFSGSLVKSLQYLSVCVLIVFSFFSLLNLVPESSIAKSSNKAESSKEVSSPSPTIKTPTPTPATAQAVQKTTTQPSTRNSEMITCIGPDEKQFETTMTECKNLNEKWGTPLDYMLNCNIHPDCGGGTVYMAKSQCDQPCAGLSNRKHNIQLPENNTSSSKATVYCYDNVNKRSYYTTSGEQCNIDNLKSQCQSIYKGIYDSCMDRCLRSANDAGSYCIYNLSDSAMDQCLAEKDAEHRSCMDGCGKTYEKDSEQCR